MGIVGAKVIGGMAARQGAAVRQPDPAGKNIQNKISKVQRQKQGLSSEQEMSVEEKAKERQELQQELSGLNTKLRQQQAKIQKEQQKEALRRETLAEAAQAEDDNARNVPDAEKAGSTEKSKANQVETGTEEEKKTNLETAEEKAVDTGAQTAEEKAADTRSPDKQDIGRRGVDGKDEEPEEIGISLQDMRAIVKREAIREQAKRRETVISRMESGIVILKGEIRQDELRGADVEKKKDELKEREQKVQKAASGLPDVKGPSRAADAARVKTDDAKEKAQASVIKSSRDGIVIAMPNRLAANEFQGSIAVQL